MDIVGADGLQAALDSTVLAGGGLVEVGSDEEDEQHRLLRVAGEPCTHALNLDVVVSTEACSVIASQSVEAIQRPRQLVTIFKPTNNPLQHRV